MLISTATDVDQSGKSYYGETNLYYVSAAGDFDCNVPLGKGMDGYRAASRSMIIWVSMNVLVFSSSFIWLCVLQK